MLFFGYVMNHPFVDGNKRVGHAAMKVFLSQMGIARQKSSSHRIYKTPWQGNPRINIQNYKGQAKAYQVIQVHLAIQKLEDDHVS
jgi:Fic family protein